MAEFTCANGKQWQIIMDAPTITKVREAHDIDLVDTSKTAKVWDLIDESDLVLLVDVLWTICGEQVTAAGGDHVDFAGGLVGEGLGNATDALVEAIVNFTPPRRRPLLTSLIQKHRDLMVKGIDKATVKLNSQDLETKVMDKLERDMDEAIDDALSNSAGTSQAPVESVRKG